MLERRLEVAAPECLEADLTSSTFASPLISSTDRDAPLRDSPELDRLDRPRLGPLRPHALGFAPPAEQEVRVTTGESKGDPAVLNPEQLLLMAASSCQMLWFLHLAAKARIDVVAYDDEAVR